MDKTDEQLAVEYQEGNEKALDLLIERYLKPIYNFSFRFMNDDSESQDITQETFVKVWKNIKKFDPQRKFKTWIFEIAKNTAYDHLKKKKPLLFSALSGDYEDFSFDETLEDNTPLADELLEGKMLEERLLKAIELLPPIYRAVLTLRFSAQLDFQEIALVLGKPLNTVKSQYRRAIIELKKNFVF